MSYFRTILKNAVSNWANMAVTLVISFFLAPFILHKIGNTYYGVWALVSQVTGYLWLLDFGVRNSVIKYVAEYHEKKDNEMLNNVLNASLKLYSSICLVCIALSIIFAVFFPVIFTKAQNAASIAQTLVVIAGLDIAQTFVFNVFIGILMGLQRYDVFNKVSIVLVIVRALLTVFFLNKGYGVISICLINLFSNTCMNLVVYAVSRRLLLFKLNFSRYGKSKSVYRMIINYSFFVFLNCVGLNVFFFSSNIIIALFLPISSVTFYVIAASLVDYMRKVIWAGTEAFSPLASQLDAKDDQSRISVLLVKGSKFSLLLGLPIAIVYLFMGKQFIGLWMGPDYSLIASNILAVLTVMTILTLPHYTINGILLGLNRHKLTANCRLIEAIANVSLSIFLTKYIGILGTALGIAIPHFIMMAVVLPFLATKVVQVSFPEFLKASYFGPMISMVPFALACYLAGAYFTPHSLLTFFVEVTFLLPIYLVVAWFFAISKEERQFCKDTLTSLAPATFGR